MNRIRALGYDWLGLLQDCEVIIGVCRACSRSNAHTKIWAPAQSLPVPSAIFERIQIDLLMLPLVESVAGGNSEPKPKRASWSQRHYGTLYALLVCHKV